MPSSTRRVCGRCRQSVPRGRCGTCDAGWTRTPDSWSGGSTRRWRNLRRRKLDHHPMCQRVGCHRLATEVHHDPPFTTDAERYQWRRLVALCHDCHADETTRQSVEARHPGR